MRLLHGKRAANVDLGGEGVDKVSTGKGVWNTLEMYVEWKLQRVSGIFMLKILQKSRQNSLELATESHFVA